MTDLDLDELARLALVGKHEMLWRRMKDKGCPTWRKQGCTANIVDARRWIRKFSARELDDVLTSFSWRCPLCDHEWVEELGRAESAVFTVSCDVCKCAFDEDALRDVDASGWKTAKMHAARLRSKECL